MILIYSKIVVTNVKLDCNNNYIHRNANGFEIKYYNQKMYALISRCDDNWNFKSLNHMFRSYIQIVNVDIIPNCIDAS
jgi:hypothetical protein